MTALKPLAKCASVFLPGDRVTLLAAEVPLMPSISPGDIGRMWAVRSCACDACRSGRLVCVDQRTLADDAWRHIARSRLALVYAS